MTCIVEYSLKRKYGPLEAKNFWIAADSNHRPFKCQPAFDDPNYLALLFSYQTEKYTLVEEKDATKRYNARISGRNISASGI